MEIRKATRKDFTQIMNLVKTLPEWFDDHAVNFEIPNDLKFHDCFVAEENQKIIGFISFSTVDGDAFVSWIGIDPASFRQGIGTALITKTCEQLHQLDFRKLKVKTLSKNIKYKPYAATHNFYKKMGFKKVGTEFITDNKTGEKLEMDVLEKSI